ANARAGPRNKSRKHCFRHQRLTGACDGSIGINPPLGTLTIMKQAPGSPGIPARWTSAEKSGVGTALTPLSRVWFTLSHGILNEIYYPRTDRACTRDFGLLVADGQSYFSEEKRDCKHHIETLED